MSDLIQKPFLKWAGGKTRVIPQIRSELPQRIERLVEPFVGSGAVSLNVKAQHYWMNDVNADVIDCFNTLKNDTTFITHTRTLFVPEHNTETCYYQFRDEFNQCTDPARRAALFIYLNRHGYNGLCRYNRSGKFNVPFGRYTKPRFPEKELEAFREHAQKANITKIDFRDVLAQCKTGDIVYCDPPYLPLSATAQFTNYSTSGFTQKDQADLATLAKDAAERGALVILSNHDTPVARTLYRGTRIKQFEVSRRISCIGSKRKRARELIAVFQ